MKFQIKDLTSNKVLQTVEGKAVADRTFVDLQKKYPTRKLWLKMKGDN